MAIPQHRDLGISGLVHLVDQAHHHDVVRVAHFEGDFGFLEEFVADFQVVENPVGIGREDFRLARETFDEIPVADAHWDFGAEPLVARAIGDQQADQVVAGWERIRPPGAERRIFGFGLPQRLAINRGPLRRPVGDAEDLQFVFFKVQVAGQTLPLDHRAEHRSRGRRAQHGFRRCGVQLDPDPLGVGSATGRSGLDHDLVETIGQNGAGNVAAIPHDGSFGGAVGRRRRQDLHQRAAEAANLRFPITGRAGRKGRLGFGGPSEQIGRRKQDGLRVHRNPWQLRHRHPDRQTGSVAGEVDGAGRQPAESRRNGIGLEFVPAPDGCIRCAQLAAGPPAAVDPHLFGHPGGIAATEFNRQDQVARADIVPILRIGDQQIGRCAVDRQRQILRAGAEQTGLADGVTESFAEGIAAFAERGEIDRLVPGTAIERTVEGEERSTINQQLVAGEGYTGRIARHPAAQAGGAVSTSGEEGREFGLRQRAGFHHDITRQTTGGGRGGENVRLGTSAAAGRHKVRAKRRIPFPIRYHNGQRIGVFTQRSGALSPDLLLAQGEQRAAGGHHRKFARAQPRRKIEEPRPGGPAGGFHPLHQVDPEDRGIAGIGDLEVVAVGEYPEMFEVQRNRRLVFDLGAEDVLTVGIGRDQADLTRHQRQARVIPVEHPQTAIPHRVATRVGRFGRSFRGADHPRDRAAFDLDVAALPRTGGQTGQADRPMFETQNEVVGPDRALHQQGVVSRIEHVGGHFETATVVAEFGHRWPLREHTGRQRAAANRFGFCQPDFFVAVGTGGDGFVARKVPGHEAQVAPHQGRRPHRPPGAIGIALEFGNALIDDQPIGEGCRPGFVGPLDNVDVAHGGENFIGEQVGLDGLPLLREIGQEAGRPNGENGFGRRVVDHEGPRSFAVGEQVIAVREWIADAVVAPETGAALADGIGRDRNFSHHGTVFVFDGKTQVSWAEHGVMESQNVFDARARTRRHITVVEVEVGDVVVAVPDDPFGGDPPIAGTVDGFELEAIPPVARR